MSTMKQLLTTKLKGFTLIELLVVISIIGILSSVVVSQLYSAVGKARDAKRLSDIHTIATALQAFYLDHNRFPDGSDGISIRGECIGGECGGADPVPNVLPAALAPYLSNPLPKDPLHNCPDNIDGTGVEAGNCDDKYFYSYDFTHAAYIWDGTNCSNNPIVVGDSISGAAVIAINKLEKTASPRKDVCYGSDMNQDEASYSEIICANGNGRDCFQSVTP